MKEPTTPKDRLSAFKDFQDFVEYTEVMFKLEPEEFCGLYKVLLKLQSLGEDPKEVLRTWKKHTCQEECPEFIRFMIQVDKMPIEDFNFTDDES